MDDFVYKPRPAPSIKRLDQARRARGKLGNKHISWRPVIVRVEGGFVGEVLFDRKKRRTEVCPTEMAAEKATAALREKLIAMKQARAPTPQ